MSKSLRELIGILATEASAVGDIRVSALSADSRTVTPGTLFVAIRGAAADGHDYLAAALEKGAVAVVYDRPEAAAVIPAGVPSFLVSDSRRAAALLADHFWEHPSGKLTLVAVTGTNGKTTTVHLLESIFGAAGHSTGMIGTLGRRVGGETVEASRTTPDAIELQSLLAQMVAQGVTHVAMELSSHALDLDRAWGTSFAAGVFTNLSPDHLDWHGDMETYRRSKTRLFTDYVALADRGMVGAINLDDAAGRLIAQAAQCPVIGYGLGAEAPVRATNVLRTAFGTSFNLVTPQDTTPVKLELVGPYNLANALAAAACAYGLGLDREAIAQGLGALQCVPGRLEKVDRGQPFGVLVDYAHTGDALENVLRAVRELNPARLIVVFGCGGDRDKTKRPVMGKAATELADWTIITSDNPRSEDPLDIIAQIEQGAIAGRYQVEPDRAAALRAALRRAQAGDIVVLAGKGHENYQEFEDGRRLHFDDREVAAAVLDELAAGEAGR